MKNNKQRLYHQTPLKILSLLSCHCGDKFCEGDIQKITKSSAGAINQTLRILLNLDIVSREAKGNLFLYTVNQSNCTLKYFKIFETLLYIHNIVRDIKHYASEIVLYGSCAHGENTENSDIDIFIKTEYVSKVRKIINRYRTKDETIKAVVLDPLEIASSRKEDEVFFTEVRKGIVLWKGKPIYEGI